MMAFPYICGCMSEYCVQSFKLTDSGWFQVGDPSSDPKMESDQISSRMFVLWNDLPSFRDISDMPSTAFSPCVLYPLL